MAEEDGCVVRVRGLPWSASQDEVANFLSGMQYILSEKAIFTAIMLGSFTIF